MAKIPDRKNMTTADILAFCRAEVSGGGGAAPDEAAESVESAAAPEAKPEKPAAKPGSTADILAAARASAGGAKAAPKAKPAGGKPKSTADILAAARAAGGGAAKAKVEKPAAGGKKKAAPVAEGGEKPSVQEMLTAFRSQQESAVVSPVEGGEPPRMPVLPRKPKVKPSPSAVSEERRSFLAALLVVPSAFVAAWTMLAAATVAWGMALVRFGLPNVLVEPPSKFKIGSPGEYDLGTVSTKYKAERGIWVVRTDRYEGANVIVALSTVCTHLGCTPNWLEGEQKFKCPCHGSGFYIDGVNFEGPAPRPLERHGISIAADGMLEVDKSLKFQEEMGQWGDPKSYVKV